MLSSFCSPVFVIKMWQFAYINIDERAGKTRQYHEYCMPCILQLFVVVGCVASLEIVLIKRRFVLLHITLHFCS